MLPPKKNPSAAAGRDASKMYSQKRLIFWSNKMPDACSRNVTR